MVLFAVNYGTLFIIILGLAGWCVVSFRTKNKTGVQPERIKNDINMEAYLYKMARVTGNSEYDIFSKSAEIWSVSQSSVEKDFGDYLRKGQTPHYVNDFVRENKHHLDELRMPRW